MTSTLWLLIALGILVVLALATYAALLWMRVFRQQQEQKDRVAAHNARVIESIRLIAVAMQQEQCELSEGCIRLTVLLDHLALPDRPDFPRLYPAIHEMHERIRHMPTHDARKACPAETIERLDKEREGYEVEMADEIQSDIRRLLEWIRKQHT